MKRVSITTKAPQVRLQRNNTTAIRHTLCYAAALLGITALLIGCPDNTGGDNGNDNGTPSEATQVQSSTSDATAISANSITLNWTLPTDTNGYMGVTISEQDNSGSLSEPAELDDSATEYQVTNLESATEYTFAIATRYTDSGKNNSTTVTVTTLSVPTPATQVQNATSSAITTDTITLNWAAPTDTAGFLGVTISEQNNAGSLLSAVDVDAETTTYQVTALTPATEYTFTIATRYTDSGKNNDTIVTAVTAVATAVQGVVLDAAETTSNSATVTWDNPVDTDGYTEITVTIGVDPAVDGLTPQSIAAADPNILTISGLTAGTLNTLTLIFATEYSDTTKNSSSSHIIPVTTQSNRVTNVIASDITTDSVTLSWTDPEDRVRYSGVMISASTAAGDMITPQMIDATAGSTAEQVTIADLAGPTAYTFTLTTQYSDDAANNTKSGGSTEIMATTLNSIDTDGDTLIDINSLERLDNVRYNLDLGAAGDDGRYKESTQTAENAGLLCGNNADAPCTGYELTRSLDFADAGSYDSGVVNAEWRPTGGDPNAATNTGWDPIGECNADTSDSDIDICGDEDDTFLATRFEGNGYAISNLYSRNHRYGGLFAATESTGTIRSIGMATAHIYDSTQIERIGTLAGINHGTIVASYASNGTINGNAATEGYFGGLVGLNTGTIVASYVTGYTLSITSGSFTNVGGLVGNNINRIIASYANSSVAVGQGGTSAVGGLVGYNFAPASTVTLLNPTVGTIIAGYATGTVTDGAGNNSRIGGLVGLNEKSRISASYATVNITDGTGTSTGGALVGVRISDTVTASYGFGTVTLDTVNTHGAPPSGTTTAALLAAPNPDDSTNTAVDAIWNDANSTTFNAWDFGDNTQPPALRYADYDGAGTEYGCGTTTGSIATIPSIIATPTGPMSITCGSTLLLGQEGR